MKFSMQCVLFSISWMSCQCNRQFDALEVSGQAGSKGQPKKNPQNRPGQYQGPRKLRKGPMPAVLRGGVPANSDGKSVCFGYNLGTCKSDGDCPKGLYICCHPKCFQKHTYVSKYAAA